MSAAAYPHPAPDLTLLHGVVFAIEVNELVVQPEGNAEVQSAKAMPRSRALPGPLSQTMLEASFASPTCLPDV